MRLLILLALAGCFTGGSSLELQDDNAPNPGGGAGLGACAVDEDCVPAAVTCCECPTFATNVGDPKTAVCEDVDCMPGNCPDNVEAACGADNVCELRCKPLACETTCDRGYALDANGCLSCACAAVPPSNVECGKDADCVQTRADCCGCKSGGIDTAVPVAQLASFDSSLMCSSTPQCPNVDTCDATQAPRCVQGQCELLPELPPGACGRPDLPACSATEVCTVNSNDPANLYGVGICQPR